MPVVSALGEGAGEECKMIQAAFRSWSKTEILSSVRRKRLERRCDFWVEIYLACWARCLYTLYNFAMANLLCNRECLKVGGYVLVDFERKRLPNLQARSGT